MPNDKIDFILTQVDLISVNKLEDTTFFMFMAIFLDKKFEFPTEIITATTREEFIYAFERIDFLRSQKYILGYIEYEAWKIFCDIEDNSSTKSDFYQKSPLLYFEVYDEFQKYIPTKHNKTYKSNLAPRISKKEYFCAIEKIKKYLSEGMTYQVNYSYPSTFFTDADNDLSLFEFLLSSQPSKYAAFLKGGGRTVLSFSPELFFRICNGKITAEPMKGTIARGTNKSEDLANQLFLSSDEKNRAENLMIVDLLRNDLSRISKPGSVEVENMFEVQTLPTLHQMTSRISAQLCENISSFEIFEKLFPCGSVTGAPKISTMRIIESLECEPRGVYCGAICLFSPKETVCSVPIRILQRSNNENHFTYRAGGGIVWDSTANEEWMETLCKSKFVSNDFKIIETILVKSGNPTLLDLHANRMERSAEFFGFNFDKEKFLHIVPEHDGIMRIELSRDGKFVITYRDIFSISTNIIEISNKRLDEENVFLRHKTDVRYWYADTNKKISEGRIFDEIFLNSRNEITEGSRSNIVILKNGTLYTPPISCGLLGGVFREIMGNKLTEKILKICDLESAEKIFCINSVRGMVEVKLHK